MRPAAQCRVGQSYNVLPPPSNTNNYDNGLTLTLTNHSQLHFINNHQAGGVGVVGDVGSEVSVRV